MFFLANLLA